MLASTLADRYIAVTKLLYLLYLLDITHVDEYAMHAQPIIDYVLRMEEL